MRCLAVVFIITYRCWVSDTDIIIHNYEMVGNFLMILITIMKCLVVDIIVWNPVTAQTVLTRRPSSEDVLVNSTATLSCEASASQNMDMVYSWKFNNHHIDVEKNPYYRLVRTVLHFVYHVC